MARITLVQLDGSDELMKDALEHAVRLLTLAGQPRPEPAPLPSPVATLVKELAPPAPKRRPRVPREPAAEAPPHGSANPMAQARIRAMLQKRPMQSSEIVQVLSSEVHASTVYLALKNMRSAGVIETREDAADGYKKNFLL